jgi:hypothetical protein
MDQGWRDIACAKSDGTAMNMKKKSGSRSGLTRENFCVAPHAQ